MSRSAKIHRTTAETNIELALELDGIGTGQIATGVGFLDHMLTLFAKHGLFDLSVTCQGDLHIDAHHSVEDVGICLGQAFAQALGDKKGIHRYGSFTLPMDETLVTTAVDLSGRQAVVWKVKTPAERVGEFDTELAQEFWIAFAGNARCNYHALLHHGENSHHILEAVFKCSARALRQAVAIDSRNPSAIPSTKGSL